MAVFNPQVGDIGNQFVYEFEGLDCNGVAEAKDISAATTIDVCFKKPITGTLITRVGAFAPAPCGNGTGTDGIANYISVAGDLDEAGEWETAAKVILSTGETLFSNTKTFIVETPLCA